MNIIAFANRFAHRKPPKTESGYKGVSFQKHVQEKPWKAYCRHHGMYLTIGYFETAEEAAAAYNRKAKEIFGEKAWLNPIQNNKSC